MNPNLSLDEFNIAIEHKMDERNNRPNPDFHGLSSNQMTNWLYAPFNELAWVTIRTPDDLSSSPVMRYLKLILDEASQNGGSFKATSKGNLPAKLVKEASNLRPEFAVAQHQTPVSICEFSGSNEDKFNALHYTRILAEIAGVIYRKSGRYHVKKTALERYHTHGINAFFKPMLETVIGQYNWSYFDSLEHDTDLRTFWLFMLWRLQSHANVDQLAEEMAIAFPELLLQISKGQYLTPTQQLNAIIESRFARRFLQFWGFITINPKRFLNGERIPLKAQIQPILEQTFQFTV